MQIITVTAGEKMKKSLLAKWIYKPYSKRVWILNILQMLLAIDQVAVAVVIQYVIDAAVSGGSFALWAWVLAGVLFLLVVLHSSSSWISGSTADRCTATLRKELLIAAENREAGQLQQYHSGELMNRGMEDVKTLCDGMVTVMPAVVGHITRLIGAVAVIFALYPGLIPILLVAGGIMGVTSALLRPALRKQHKRVRKTEDSVLSNLQENLQQMELIQSLQMKDTVLCRFIGKQKKNLRAKRTRRFWQVGIHTMISIASQIGTGALLIWGAGQVGAGAMSYGTLTAMIQLLAIFRGPIIGLSGLISQLAAVEVAHSRLQDLISKNAEKTLQEMPERNVKSVVFENVTFSYPGEDTPVISSFSGEFPMDGWCCLTGTSGRGKTTLYRLILGIYTPQTGRVYLKTEEGFTDCSVNTRYLFSYVPQDYALFSGTVRENLLLVKPDATEEELTDVLKMAECDFLLQMPEGLDTSVYEQNSGLSKGQIQRIAIARAILMNRPILLLDECTSALDKDTEERVLKNLKDLGTRALVVTHRPEVLDKLENVAFINL